jgi:RNA polymerase sigma-70 factor (ECF subfamily)
VPLSPPEAYRHYGRALLRKAERILGSAEDARDIVQGLFVDLCRAENPPMDLPYLYRAVTHRCLTYLRDESNRARLLAHHDVALQPSPRTHCESRAIGQDLMIKLLRELDEGEGEVLAYRFLDDMTQEEIAALLGLSRKTIAKRLERIRIVLGALTGSEGEASR